MTTEEQARTGLWTVKKVANLLGVPVSWVYSHVAEGTLPHHKIGRYVRFDPREIAAYLKAAHRG